MKKRNPKEFECSKEKLKASHFEKAEEHKVGERIVNQLLQMTSQKKSLVTFQNNTHFKD
ncbi:hypothetical protein PPL_12126 [Heterostelium album PN500]|uniref:Uncharacterized protein n=1 Tax=Heterostelium pallidum (strain ATCC 26659 / Pp 5 / PN500) TaxID=670386 RepID=D3BLS2_HETP5|nr:hypothetical protein PPL_12126 [Heterostelium album PN500]EFA77523.1 hypothetical protein PPL_12126 [Heterostelium album PN500]|eukprot:XP_020429651.1 hypothetical protein PPL_12126 [Heterostelium album PN500]